MTTAGIPLLYPVFRACDANGNPLSGGKLWSYQAGTTTPVTTYHEATLQTPWSNPIILDANGEAVIFTNQPLHLLLTDANGNQLWSMDHWNGSLAFQAANAVQISGGTIQGITPLAVADGGTGADNADDARTNLEIGSIATQNGNAVTITGGSITGITDLAMADGGTGASDAATARTNLGLASMATQAAGAVTISGGSITGLTRLTASNATLLFQAGSATAGSAPIQLTAGTNLSSPATGAMEFDGSHLYFTPGSTRYTILTTGETTLSPTFAGLTLTTPLAVAQGGTGATTVAAAATALGLGGTSTPSFAGLTLSAPLPVASGGTGAITAATALTSLGAAGIGVAQTFTKAQSGVVIALTSANGHVAIDASLGNYFSLTLTENTMLDFPSNLVAGTPITIFITQNAGVVKTISFYSGWNQPGGGSAVATTTTGAKDAIFAIAISTSQIVYNYVNDIRA